jgi:hypothetical protein
VVPVLFNAAKVGVNSAKVATKSVKAISKLSGQSAKTANRAQKLDQRIGKNLNNIEGAVADAGKAAATAVVNHVANDVGQDSVPSITATSSSAESNTPTVSSAPAAGTANPAPYPRQPLPCGSPNTTGCGR